VLVALEGQRGRGSGRSIPAFDLLEGLGACAEHLIAYGGHHAAAGLELEHQRLESFRSAFAAHAQANLTDHDLVPAERVDAVVSVAELGLPLAEELERLAPFGHGNPAVTLMVRGAQVADVRSMGEGKHARFRLLGDGAQAAAVCFGAGPRLAVEEGQPVDATFKLEINEWRGVCEPRVVLRHALPSTHHPRSLDLAAERLAPASEPLQLALAVP
jgi:single-stranded-DNA-specific exonuclease